MLAKMWQLLPFQKEMTMWNVNHHFSSQDLAFDSLSISMDIAVTFSDWVTISFLK